MQQLGITKQIESDRLSIVRLRMANNGEVPFIIAPDFSGSRPTGIYRWDGACDEIEKGLYLSIRQALITEPGTKTLQKKQSRLDNGSQQAGKAKVLEIAIAHSGKIDPDKLAYFVHLLRNRWPYFADYVELPFPFPFAKATKEYAVCARDQVEILDDESTEESE